MYVVAIPSYKRHDIICSKTLRMLTEGGVPMKSVYVFVADKTEAETYKKAVPAEVHIVVGKKGITPQRQFIVEYFKKGTHVVSIDDDVAGIYEKDTEGRLVNVGTGVHAFFERAFAECVKRGIYLWGVYPVANAFYMPGGVSTSLKFILGTLYGFVNRPEDKKLRPCLKEKEDFEISILYYLKDGGVLRFNDYTIKTKFHNAVGGLGCLTQKRFQANEEAAQELKRRYPDLGYVWHRKNGMAEWRFYPTRRGAKQPSS